MSQINKAVDFHAHPVDEVFRREIEKLGIDVLHGGRLSSARMERKIAA